MKQTTFKKKSSSLIYKYLLSMLVLFIGETNLQASIVGCADSVTNTFSGGTAVRVVIQYPQCVCVGDIFQIQIQITFGSGYSNLANYEFQNLAPALVGAPGLTFVPGSQTGPFPVILVCIPSSTCYMPDNGITYCSGTGMGQFVVPSGTPAPVAENIPYTLTYELEATGTGVQTWTPVFSVDDLGCESMGAISISVTERATVIDGHYGPICEGSTLDSVLPAPGNTTGSFFFAVGSPTGGTVTLINAASGTFMFDTTPGFSGTAMFEYNVYPTGPGLQEFCPAAASGTVTIDVDQNPVAASPTFTGCADQGITGNLAPFVTGGSGSFTFSQTGMASCGSVVVNPDGTFIFTGPTGVADCTFVYAATDTSFPNCVGTGLVTVNINPTPTALDQTIGTCINQPVSGTLTASSGGTATITSFAIVTPPTNGMITAFNAVTGTFTYTPNPGFTGTDSFTFTATDSNGCMSPNDGTVTIDVNPMPITSSTAVFGCENTSFTGSLVPLVTGGTGAFVFSQTGAGPSCGGVLINSDGSFTFSPNFGFTGSCSFQYAVTEGGCLGTGPHTVTVTILPAPIATSAITGICKGGTVDDNLNNYVISATGMLTFTGFNVSNGALNLQSSGPFTFTPSITSGNAGFNFQVMSNLLSCPSAVETYTIVVHPGPTVSTGTVSACDGSSRVGNLTNNVSGTPPFTFTGPFSETNGTVTINGNGTFTFTPNPGVTGGSFTYGVADVFGCTAAGAELVVVNPSPSASGTSTGVCSGNSLMGSLVGLVSGGTPPYIFSQGGPSTGGTVIINPNGTFTFTPNSGATSGSFIFRVTDSKGCFATAEVMVIINPGPTASTGMFTGCEGSPLMGSLVPLVTGPNPPFTFSGPIGETGGIATVNPDGTFTFIPTIFTGQASFDYIVTDSAVPPCTSRPTPVFIFLEQGPVALPATFEGCEDTPFSSGLNNFVSGGLPPFTFSQVGPSPACGAVVVFPDGTFDFTPTAGFTGPCTFVWQVADSTPCLSNTAPATVIVNNNPVASDSGPLPACQNNPFTGNLNNFTTGGNPPYSFTGDNAINGTVNISPTGPFVFTPGFILGPASFTFNAIDMFGCESNTGTISFTVEESPTGIGPSPINTCLHSPITSTLTVTGGVPPYTAMVIATVNGSAVIDSVIGGVVTFTFTPSPSTPFPTPTTPGSVTIEVTDSNPDTGGCSVSITIDINIHQNPIVSSTSVTSCSGTLSGSLINLVTGSVPPFIFGATGPVSPLGCGTVVISPLGDFVFTSPAGFSGPCTFEFQVTDNSVSHCVGTGAVTVNVDIPPVVQDLDLCACAPGVPLISTLADLVVSGTPPFTFSIVGGICTSLGLDQVRCTVSGGTVFLNTVTGEFIFQPTAGFLGTAEFMFQVTDASGCVSNVGTVLINVPCCPTGVTV